MGEFGCIDRGEALRERNVILRCSILAKRERQDSHSRCDLHGGRWVGMASMQQVDCVAEKRVIIEMRKEMCK